MVVNTSFTAEDLNILKSIMVDSETSIFDAYKLDQYKWDEDKCDNVAIYRNIGSETAEFNIPGTIMTIVIVKNGDNACVILYDISHDIDVFEVRL